MAFSGGVIQNMYHNWYNHATQDPHYDLRDGRLARAETAAGFPTLARSHRKLGQPALILWPGFRVSRPQIFATSK